VNILSNRAARHPEECGLPRCRTRGTGTALALLHGLHGSLGEPPVGRAHPRQYDKPPPNAPLPLLPMAGLRSQTRSPDRHAAPLRRASLVSRMRRAARSPALLQDGPLCGAGRGGPRPRLPRLSAILVRGSAYPPIRSPAANAAAGRGGAGRRRAGRHGRQRGRGRGGRCLSGPDTQARLSPGAPLRQERWHTGCSS
jgi:hypothetical protein